MASLCGRSNFIYSHVFVAAATPPIKAHFLPVDLIDENHFALFKAFAQSGQFRMQRRKLCHSTLSLIFSFSRNDFFFSHFFGIHNSIATTDFTIFLVQYCGGGWWCKENCVRPKCRLSFMEHYIHFLPILMNNTEHTQRRHSKRQMASKKKKNSIWCVTCVLNSLLLNSPNLSSSLATMGSGIAHWPHFHTLFSI